MLNNFGIILLSKLRLAFIPIIHERAEATTKVNQLTIFDIVVITLT